MNTLSSSAGDEIDRHRVQTPFAHTRVHHPEVLRRLLTSIDAAGQQVPLIAVEADGALVLVDGYRRWEVLRRLGRDTARVVIWRCPLPEALAQVLARHQARAFEPIEQAWLLAEVLAEGMSQRAVAARVGKDPSWVSRRMALLSALGEPLLSAVREGVLSTWAANRVFVPLARANAADAKTLLAHQRAEPLSTRQLARWFAHYRRANRAARERLLAHPRLFIQSLEAPALEMAAEPEARWLEELERLRRQLERLRRALIELLEPDPPRACWQALRAAVAKTAQSVERLRQPLEEVHDAHRAAATDDSRAPSQGDGGAPDQPHPGPLAQHGAPGAERA